MWLDRVKTKLQNKDYKMMREFVGDVRLIFQNCHIFNKVRRKHCVCVVQYEHFFSTGVVYIQKLELEIKLHSTELSSVQSSTDVFDLRVWRTLFQHHLFTFL